MAEVVDMSNADSVLVAAYRRLSQRCGMLEVALKEQQLLHRRKEQEWALQRAKLLQRLRDSTTMCKTVTEKWKQQQQQCIGLLQVVDAARVAGAGAEGKVRVEGGSQVDGPTTVDSKGRTMFYMQEQVNVLQHDLRLSQTLLQVEFRVEWRVLGTVSTTASLIRADVSTGSARKSAGFDRAAQ